MTPPRERERTPTLHRESTPAYDQGTKDSSSAPYHDPFDPEAQDPFEPDSTEGITSGHAQYDRNLAAPPAPALNPTRRRSSHFDHAQESTSSPGTGPPRNNRHALERNGSSIYGKCVSPTKLQVVKAVGDKARRYDHSSDDDRSNERRRQHDDVNAKLKRRQPRVAEAYR